MAKKRNSMALYVSALIAVFSIFVVLNILKQISFSSLDKKNLEPERIEFLKKMPSLYLKDKFEKPDGSRIEYTLQVYNSPVDNTPIELINVAIYSYIYSNGYSSMQNYSIPLNQKKIDIRWFSLDNNHIQYIDVIFENKKTGIHSSSVDKEKAEKLYERAMSWVFEVRKYFGVETLDGLKKAVEKQKEKQKKERFDFK